MFKVYWRANLSLEELTWEFLGSIETADDFNQFFDLPKKFCFLFAFLFFDFFDRRTVLGHTVKRGTYGKAQLP